MLNKRPVFRSLWVALAPLALFACASGSINEAPKALAEPIPSDVKIDIPWFHILADDFSAKAFGQLKPTVVDDSAFVALSTGEVFAVNQAGKVKAVASHPTEITTSLVVADEQFVFADADGRINLASAEFDIVWSADLNAIAVEAPLVTAQRIFVQTIDGRVNALERVTGRLLWSYQDAEPKLTLTGTSTPVLINTDAGQAIVTGLANGKLVALSVQDGSVIWEYRITRASGKTDISRLVDVDAQVTVVGESIIATAYQGDLVVVDTKTGQVKQAKAFSSYRSILAEGGSWFGVDAQSHLVSFNPVTLQENWRNDDFEYRLVSELVKVDDWLVGSDSLGFLHVVDANTGKWLASRHIDWRGAKTDPVKFADGLLMQGHSTRLKYIELVANN